MKNLYFGMLLIQVSGLISSILAMEVPACSDNSRLCKKLEASGRCTDPKVAKKCPKSCLNCCLPDTSPMCGKWKEEGLCSNETVLEQCIQTCTGCCPDNDFPCHMRDLKETVVKTCSPNSPGAGDLTLLDNKKDIVCSIIWNDSPKLQTFNIAQGFSGCDSDKRQNATMMNIGNAGKGTTISVNGLPASNSNGAATSTTILDVVSDTNRQLINSLDATASYPGTKPTVKAENFPIVGGLISNDVSTVTISIIKT